MQVDRAQGRLFGQLAHDALGSLVKLQSLGQTRLDYQGGVRELVDGGGMLSPGGPRTTQRWRCCLPGCWPRVEPTMAVPRGLTPGAHSSMGSIFHA